METLDELKEKIEYLKQNLEVIDINEASDILTECQDYLDELNCGMTTQDDSTFERSELESEIESLKKMLEMKIEKEFMVM